MQKFILMGINILFIISIIIAILFMNSRWIILPLVLIGEIIVYKILYYYYYINNNNNNKEISNYKTIYWIYGEISLFIIIFALNEYLKQSQPNFLTRLIYVVPTYIIILCISPFILVNLFSHKKHLKLNTKNDTFKSNKIYIILSFAFLIAVKFIWIICVPETKFINTIYYNLFSFLVTFPFILIIMLILRIFKANYNKSIFYIGALILTFTPIEIYLILYILISPILCFFI